MAVPATVRIEASAFGTEHLDCVVLSQWCDEELDVLKNFYTVDIAKAERNQRPEHRTERHPVVSILLSGQRSYVVNKLPDLLVRQAGE